MHVEFHSSNEGFHLRTSWMRILRIRIDDCEIDSIRDRIVIQNWIIDRLLVIRDWIDDFRVVIQNQIDDFECLYSGFDEYQIHTECVICTRCDFALKMLQRWLWLKKRMIKMLEMTIMTESRMIESRVIKFLVIRFCDSELLMTTCDKIFSLILFDSAFISHNKDSWTSWTWSLFVCLFDQHDSIKTLVCNILVWSNFNCLARVYFKFRDRSSRNRSKLTLTVHNPRLYWSNNSEIDELHNDWRDLRSNHCERLSEVLDHWFLTQQQMMMHVLVRKMILVVWMMIWRIISRIVWKVIFLWAVFLTFWLIDSSWLIDQVMR
jgi:hypothetical protein